MPWAGGVRVLPQGQGRLIAMSHVPGARLVGWRHEGDFFSAWQVVSKQVGTWHAARHQTPIVILAGGKIISMHQMQLQDLPLENCCGHLGRRKKARITKLGDAGLTLWF